MIKHLKNKPSLRIIAPSGAMENTAILPRAVKRLKRMGLSVELDKQSLLINQRFAGTDQQRAKALESALLDPNIHIIMAARGGYGAHRLLPLINWQTIAKSIHKKIIIGHSDFTAIQLALFCQGVSSIAGPCAGVDFGGIQCNRLMKHSFSTLIHTHYTYHINNPYTACDAYLNTQTIDTHIPTDIHLKFLRSDSHIHTDPNSYKEFNSNGTLWGGNLTMLCSLLGTPYFPKLEQIKGGILFIEDINERPFRIERMLNQLYLAGVLDSQSAVLWGDFGQPSIIDYDRGYNLDSVIDYVRNTLSLKERLITGLPFGHCPKKLSLPIGVNVNLNIDSTHTVHIKYAINNI